MIEWWNSLTVSQQVLGPVLLIITAAVSQMMLTQDKRATKSKPATVQTCKNRKCGELVSISKITGDYCTLCHVKDAPVPELPKPKQAKMGIIKEVSND